jgi:hypothetical protein
MSLILNGTDGLSDVDGTAGTPAIRGTDANTGIFFPAADVTAISTGGTERMRITSAGRVGIGTTTPTSNLQVTGAGSGTFGAYNDPLNVKGSDYTLLYVNGTNGVAATIYDYNSSNGWYTGTNNSAGYRIGYMSSIDQTGVSNAKDGSLGLTIDTGGNVGIGTASPSQKLHVDGGSGMSSSALIARFFGTSGNSMLIRGSGNVENTNGVYGAISDAKLKENIVDATPKLEDLCKVKVRQYNLIGDNKKQIGVVAQELEEVFAGLVDESADKDEDGNNLGTTTKSVKYSVFVPMLLKAIQELNAKVDAQALEIAALKAAP